VLYKGNRRPYAATPAADGRVSDLERAFEL